MPNYFYARKSKSWKSENQNTYILKLGCTHQIEFRKWWGSTERLYPCYYDWYLDITDLGRFKNVVSAEKTIFQHSFFSKRQLNNGEGSGQEFYEFDTIDNPLEKASDLLIQYDVHFSIIHGDPFMKKPRDLVIKEEIMELSEPLPPITKTQTKEIEPRKYQLEAVESMIPVDKGILILATGTGKTVIYSLYIKKCKGRYLIVVPSKTLVNQTTEKCNEILGDEFKFYIYKTGIKLPSRDHCKNLVVVGTYQNSHNIIKYVEDLDCIFFDECHSTVILKPTKTQKELSRFQTLLDYPCKKKFFATATEKNITSDTEKPISMDDEKIYGPVLYRYTLGEAISEGYLTDYTFDIVGTRDKKESILYYIKSRFKCIIFCSNLETVEYLYSNLCNSLKTTNIKVFKLGYYDDIKINTERFSDSKNQCVMVCCKKINIGYDEPQIDTVIHYDISTSSIMTIQRNGRALRLSPDKVMAKIVFLCDLSGDSESQREEIKKLQAPIAYLQLHDSRLSERIKKEHAKPIGQYKSINIILQDTIECENVKVYDRFWNLLGVDGLTYTQCKDLIKRSEYKVNCIKKYMKLSEIETRLPENPEEKFGGSFKGWVDYLSFDKSLYYSKQECQDIIEKNYNDIAHIPQLSKRCKALRKTDHKFPPVDMWIHLYELSSLEIIFPRDKNDDDLCNIFK
jgi:superfamily II DNA or RNA helicase